jgi:hypothetical protein
MNTVSSIALTASAFLPTPPAGDACTGAASSQDMLVTASLEPQISPNARALAEFYEAGSAFVKKEHLETFTGWKYDSAGYVLNDESAYLDVEKYNKLSVRQGGDEAR